MDTAKLDALVRFDQDELARFLERAEADLQRSEDEIQEKRRRIMLYRALLHDRNGSVRPTRRRKAKTIAEAAVRAIMSAGRPLHAKEIASELQKHGFMRGSKKPIPTLLTAMRRSPLIERDRSAPNTWRVGKSSAE